MKRCLLVVGILFTPLVLAESDSQVVGNDSKNSIAKADIKNELVHVAKPYVLTVQEKLDRIEYVNVTSEKELVQNESTKLDSDLEKILQEALMADDE